MNTGSLHLAGAGNCHGRYEYWDSKLHVSYGVFQVAKSNKTILLDLDVNRIPEEKRQLLDWDSGSNRESTGISKQGHSYCAVLIIN